MQPLLPSSAMPGESGVRLDLSRDSDKLATYMIILLMGPQGAGKGTQGEMLSEKLGYPLVVAGQLLRDEKATGSELGQEIARIIDAGDLVPNEMITALIEKRLALPDADGGAIFDGYPRKPGQLDVVLEKFRPDLVIVLDLDDEEAVERLSGRWMSPSGQIYNIKTNPPKVPGICDETGEKLYQRKDDTEDAIRRRLALYHEETHPLVQVLVDEGVRVEHIDASKSIEEVQEAILAVVNK